MNDIERKEEHFQKFIRKFKTKNLLEYFSMKSIEAFQNKKEAFTIVDIPYYNKTTGERGITQNFCFGQWELVQICYYAIKYSNDYRGGNVDESLFYHLLNENKIMDEVLEKIPEEMDEIKLFEHLQCLTNVQFDFQTLQIKSRFNRMYQIIRIINNNPKYNQTNEVCYIDFETEFKKITGIDLEKYIEVYYFIILITTTRKNTNLYDIINDIHFDITNLGFSKLDILNVLEIESRNYMFYKQSDNWNSLKYYPIVKVESEDNKYIISNIFSVMLSFPNSVYWILRNYYKQINSNDFTIYFGKCFEYYFQEILDCYSIKYEKLEESKKQNKKMPDWKIVTDDYIFLIEQKASLFPIDARTTTKEERYIKIEDYFDKNIVKAFKQLNSYVEKDTSKIVVRICLTYEKIYMEENAKRIVESKMDFKSDIELNWIVNIDEIEILMSLLATNYKKFKEVIEQKIILEKRRDKNGRNFEKLLGGCTYDYTENNINHFERIGNDLKQKLIDITEGEN